MKPLRIAFLAPTFLPKCSGAEVFHHNLASRLAARGHAITVVMPRARIRQLRACGWFLPYELAPYPARRWNLLKRNRCLAFWLNRRAMSALQRKHRFDVWHAFVLFPSGVVLADWQRMSRVPGLVRAVGDDVSGLPSRGHDASVDSAVREKLPSAGAVVALSAEMAAEICALGVAKEKIRVVPNAVDASRFTPSASSRLSVRAGLGIPDDAFVFLCVARNHPQKDFGTLFGAFRLLLSALPDRAIRLVVAGRDARLLRGQVGDIGDRVVLAEFGAAASSAAPPELPPQQLVELYRACDAFVLSSLLEGFSSALIEAMSAGLPLAVTDVPGIRGVVADGKEGFLVPAGSPGALADAMAKLVSDSSLRGRMSLRARETAARYDWDAVVTAYESLYRELSAGYPQP